MTLETGVWIWLIVGVKWHLEFFIPGHFKFFRRGVIVAVFFTIK